MSSAPSVQAPKKTTGGRNRKSLESRGMARLRHTRSVPPRARAILTSGSFTR